MKQRIKILLLCLLFLFSTASAEVICGVWSVQSIEKATYAGVLLPEEYSDYTVPITRGEIASLIVRAYEASTGETCIPGESPFLDDNSEAAAAVYALGLMNGRSEREFAPEAQTTRQEMAKVILSLQKKVAGEEPKEPPLCPCSLADFDAVADWAKPYVATAVGEGIFSGYEDGTFRSTRPITREEAVAIIIRAISLPEVELDYDTLQITVEEGEDSSKRKVCWNRIPDEQVYTLRVTECRNSYYEGDIAPKEPEIYEIRYEDFLPLTVHPNRRYLIELSAGRYRAEAEIFTYAIYHDDMAEIADGYPQTKEEAEALMETITIPVWRLKGGVKTASTATLTVHRDIAEKVKLVFEEIFDGEERFPIKDIGAYAWRGGTSEHNGGTAIDINSNENYCIYNDGRTIGSHWKPYEDPYSITPYGDVVVAFEKYGFTWGGDSWSNPKDYMHFSYLGR